MTAETSKTVNKYDIFGAGPRANPYPIYAQMTREDPVWLGIGPITGNRFWFITGYEESVAALKHPRMGKEFRKHVPPEVAARWGNEDPMFDVANRHMLNMDPPDHTRLRALVHKAFTPRLVEDLRPRIQQVADALLDDVLAKGAHGEIDLISAYAFPLPIIVICELLGLPSADRDQVRDWSRRLLFENTLEDSGAAAMSFAAYLHEKIEQREANPGSDLISALVRSEVEGDTLDRAELIGMLFLLLVAGHETTVNLISNGMMALLNAPDQKALLTEHPELIRTAIEEMLRYNGPIEIATWRWAFEDVELGGQTIGQGDAVLVSLAAANRDPRVFPDPDRFDITRDPNRHIAFGNGIHYCVGAPLARLEAAIAIPTLLRRLPDLSMPPGTAESLEWNNSMLLHGVRALPLNY